MHTGVSKFILRVGQHLESMCGRFCKANNGTISVVTIEEICDSISLTSLRCCITYASLQALTGILLATPTHLRERDCVHGTGTEFTGPCRWKFTSCRVDTVVCELRPGMCWFSVNRENFKNTEKHLVNENWCTWQPEVSACVVGQFERHTVSSK